MRLIEKLILLFVTISFIPLVVLGSTLYVNTRHSVSKQVLNQLQSVASLQEKRLEAIHDQNLERLEAFANRTGVRRTVDDFNRTKSSRDQQGLQGALDELKAAVPAYLRVSIADSTGKIIVSTDRTTTNTQLTNDSLLSQSRQQPVVDNLVSGPDHQLEFRLAGPMLLNNQLVGIALLDVKADSLADAARDYTGLGSTGETQIAQKLPGSPSVFIAPLRFKPGATLSTKVDPQTPMAEALAGRETTFTDATDSTDYRNHSVLAVSRYLSSNGWGVVVKIDRSEAEQPANRSRDIFLIQGFILSVGIVFIAILLARRITDPVLDIDEIAEQVGRGDLRSRVAITTNDELSNLATTFNTMLDNLQRLDTVKSEFVSLASHQLRTPASGVKARISLLLNGYAGKLTKEQQGHLQQAYDTNERQLRVVNDILNVAIIESGHMKLAKQKSSLNELLEAIGSELQGVIAGRHQTLKLDLPKQAITATVDPEKIRMVVDNLISNASKYTDDGGKISVELSQPDNDHVRLTVSDNGVGIKPADIEKLFHKFSQVDNHINKGSGRSGSAGLGLFLAKSIVELHGGTIEVQSKPHMGSSFTITLPLEA